MKKGTVFRLLYGDTTWCIFLFDHIPFDCLYFSRSRYISFFRRAHIHSLDSCLYLFDYSPLVLPVFLVLFWGLHVTSYWIPSLLSLDLFLHRRWTRLVSTRPPRSAFLPPSTVEYTASSPFSFPIHTYLFLYLFERDSHVIFCCCCLSLFLSDLSLILIVLSSLLSKLPNPSRVQVLCSYSLPLNTKKFF